MSDLDLEERVEAERRAAPAKRWHVVWHYRDRHSVYCITCGRREVRGPGVLSSCAVFPSHEIAEQKLAEHRKAVPAPYRTGRIQRAWVEAT